MDPFVPQPAHFLYRLVPAPRVSIIVLNWNGLSMLKRCLPSVTATSYPNVEVILADNASTDDSVAWVERTCPSVRIIRHPENWGFSRGYNAAVARVTSPYVVLLNNDVEVPPGWLDPLVARLEADAEIAAVQPKILQFEARHRFEYAGACGGFLDRYGYPFARGRLFYTLEPDDGQYDDARPICWASGAALMIRRSVYQETGGLDEQFFMHMEEIDLCWRIARRGHRVFVEPASYVFHMGGASLVQGSPRKVYYNFRNSLLMLYKNLSPALWRQTLPGRAALDGLAALRALLSGRLSETRAIVRAYYDAHRLKGAYRSQRPEDDPTRNLPLYRGSIIVDYFLHGHHTFSSLPAHRFKTESAGHEEPVEKQTSSLSAR